MKRQKRDVDWTDVELDDLPTEDIEPVNISPDIDAAEIDINARQLYNSLSNWFDETYWRTRETGKEHGFYVDSFGNVIGIIEGTPERLPFPPDTQGVRAMSVHTHTRADPVLSPSDISLFESMSLEAGQCLLTVPQDGRNPELFYFYRAGSMSEKAKTFKTTGEDTVTQYVKDATDTVHSEPSIRAGRIMSETRRLMDSSEDLLDFISELQIKGDNLGYSHTTIPIPSE